VGEAVAEVLGLVVAVGSGLVVVVTEGEPVSVGSVVAPVVAPGVLSPLLQAPKTVDSVNNKARPKIFVFMTPHSPIAVRIMLIHSLTKIPHLSLFFTSVLEISGNICFFLNKLCPNACTTSLFYYLKA
jgi:hypothetical protein